MDHSRSKRRSRLINNRKGYAGIIATIFLVLVVLFLFFNVYTFTNDRNTAYQDTVGQVAQMEADRNTEQATVSIVNAAIAAQSNIVYVNCNITNNGPLSAQLVRLWIKDITTNQTGNTKTSIVLQPGSITSYFNLVNIANASSSDQFAFWFETARGNAISSSPSTFTTNSNTYNLVSPLQLDGQGSGTSSSSKLTWNLNTTRSNDLIYVVLSYDVYQSVSSFSSTPSLSWNLRAGPIQIGSIGLHLVTYYAIWTSNGTISINVNFDSKESDTTSHPARLEIVLQGPSGPQGPQGDQGPQGIQGPQGRYSNQLDPRTQGHIQGLC
jgi:FlaG/FlaF family flagellin (archaellin)